MAFLGYEKLAPGSEMPLVLSGRGTNAEDQTNDDGTEQQIVLSQENDGTPPEVAQDLVPINLDALDGNNATY